MGISVIGIDSVLGNGWVECLGTGGSIRLVHVQPLATKCRVEPTISGWGRSIPSLQRPVTGGSNLRWCCLVGWGGVE